MLSNEFGEWATSEVLKDHDEVVLELEDFTDVNYVWTCDLLERNQLVVEILPSSLLTFFFHLLFEIRTFDAFDHEQHTVFFAPGAVKFVAELLIDFVLNARVFLRKPDLNFFEFLSHLQLTLQQAAAKRGTTTKRGTASRVRTSSDFLLIYLFKFYFCLLNCCILFIANI